MKIYINNETDFIIDQNVEKLIEQVIQATMQFENINEKYEVSISFVYNEQIRNLNKNYRNIDKETDVLSFPMIDFNNKFNSNEMEHMELLGDIVISIDKVKSQANEFNHSIIREICFLVVHSMLHLLGYDHEEEEERKIMFNKQKSILEEVGITR